MKGKAKVVAEVAGLTTVAIYTFGAFAVLGLMLGSFAGFIIKEPETNTVWRSACDEVLVWSGSFSSDYSLNYRIKDCIGHAGTVQPVVDLILESLNITEAA